MKNSSSLRTALALAAGALLFTACGGGGGGGGDAPIAADPVVGGSDVPSSATTRSAGALAFVRSIAAASDNTAEPLRVGDAVLATSDTEEPDPAI